MNITGTSTKQIPVGDTWAVVDATDYEQLSQHKWSINNKGYAYRSEKGENGIHKIILMHREIMQPEKGMEIHHRNHNPLDNTKENLHVCTHKENLRSLQKPKKKNGEPSTSTYKGVYRHKNGKFKVTIRCNGEQYYEGYFDDEIDAARAYDAKARELHGEFAVLNFP